MFCPNCGHEIAEGMNFCPSCGKALATAAPQAGQANAVSGSQSGGSPPRGDSIYRRPSAHQREQIGPEVGEDDLLWEGSFSGKAMIGEWLVSAVLTLVVVIAASLVGEFPYKGWSVFGVLLLVWLVPAVRLVWRRLGIRYVLTERRFFHEDGVILRTTNRIDLIDVDDVTVRRNLVGRFVNVGTVVLTSSDKTHPVIALLGINDPLEVAELIDQACHRERDRRGVYVEQV